MKKLSTLLVLVMIIDVTYARQIPVPDTLKKTADTVTVLKEVALRAAKPQFENRADKMIMNVENTLLATGNNVLELLEKAPYVTVDMNGAVAIKGIQNATIMIDGRPTNLSAADLANLLRNTQSSQIGSIEIITSPSAKYDASGNGGIINIRMKKNRAAGVNGTFSSGLQQGRMPRINSGITLNYRAGRANAYGSFNHSRMERWAEDVTGIKFFSNAFDVPQSNVMISESSRYFSDSFTGRAGLDISLSPKTTLGFLLNGFAGNEHEKGLNTNAIRPVSDPVELLVTHHTGASNWARYSGNFNFNRKIDTAGQTVSLDFDYGVVQDRSSPDYFTSYSNEAGIAGQSTYINAMMNTRITMYSVKGDYEKPLSRVSGFSAGFKSGNVRTLNSINYYFNDAFNPGRSNDFDYTESINAAYADLSHEMEKITFRAGVRTEYTHTTGKQRANTSVIKRDYIQVFPTLFFRYKWNGQHSSGITVNRRIGRPDYESLNPFVYLADPYNSWGGNPYLLPSLTRSAEINHSFKGIINWFISYNETRNGLSRLEIKDDVNTGIFSTWENLGRSRQISTGLSANLPVTKWWRMGNNLFLFNTKSTGQLGAITANSKVSSYRIMTNNSFTISSKLSAEMSYWYRPASLWGVSKTGPLSAFGLALQHKMFRDNGRIKISGTDLFRTMRMKTSSAYAGLESDYRSRSETRTARIDFSYRFGSKQVKGERQRETALEEENGRVKGRN